MNSFEPCGELRREVYHRLWGVGINPLLIFFVCLFVCGDFAQNIFLRTKCCCWFVIGKKIRVYIHFSVCLCFFRSFPQKTHSVFEDEVSSSWRQTFSTRCFETLRTLLPTIERSYILRTVKAYPSGTISFFLAPEKMQRSSSFRNIKYIFS